MSKENVAKFIKSIAETPDLNGKVAKAPKKTDEWVKIAKQEGFAFSGSDFAGFVSDMTDKKVSEADAVQTLLAMDQQLDDAQLDQVAGGVSSPTLSFSPTLFTRIGSQFGGLGGIKSSFVKTSGPTFVKSGSGMMPGGGLM